MLAAETILFGDSLTAPAATQIAKALDVSDTTIRRWRKDVDKMPYGKVVQQARNMGYTIQFVRTRRESEG